MDYFITKSTIFMEFNGESTIVHENDKKIFFKGEKLEDILNNSCIYYGSTLRGRIISSKQFIGTNYKVPILVSEKNNLLFFYIKDNDSIYWFNFLSIKSYQKIEGNLLIVFNNNERLILNASYTIFHNQILRCSRLMVVYSTR